MRYRSIAGPLVLIAIGVWFLADNLFPDLPLWEIFSLYWPVLVIGIGVVKLIERAFGGGNTQAGLR